MVLGQSTTLTGPLAELGSEATAAAQAYFEYINSQGGVHGRKIRLIALDDGYNVEKSLANAAELIEKQKVFALFNFAGTPANTALQPIIVQERIPLIAPYTGSDGLRASFNRYVFYVRAGYGAEIGKIVEHLHTRGIGRVAGVYTNNSFGKEGMESLRNSLAASKLTLTAESALALDGTDIGAVVHQIAKTRPQAIVMITTGRYSIDFVKAFKQVDQGTQFFMLSVMGSQAQVRGLGPDGVGVVVSQVAPYPYTANSRVVQQYQHVMRRMGVAVNSFSAMEGFLNANVVVEALRRCGRNLTRERFIAALESMRDVDFGGYAVNYGPNDRLGSRFVELTVISRDGRLIR